MTESSPATALGLVPGLGAVADLLTELAVSAQTIEEIKEILNRSIERIEAKPMDRTAETTFGESWWGGELGRHTSIAERHVVEAMSDLVTGLSGYRDSVEWTWRQIEGADGDTQGRLNNLTDRAQNAPYVQINESAFDNSAACVDQEDFETNDVCEVPTGDN